MKVAGFTPNSFVDYPGNIAAVIFFGGCNFDCWFCHNRWLLSVDNLYDIEEILKRIETNKDFLDAVVLSGGEATLQNSRELIELIKRIKAMGLKVKLDTNGTNYQTLKELLPYLDYVAMDIKAPLSKYREITCIDDNQMISLKNSINLLKSGEIDCEFRTTFIPTLTKDDILEIAHTLKGCRHYYLQQYVPVPDKDIPPHPPKYLIQTQREVSKIIPCEIRGI
ncbi:MAG: anaerobic ribonucleoside-triphosphate reductase activating protein [Christensenellales bacterium]|nr:anaerobic ribonucleoside-triphosphate reductase activating protein [Clostridiales bacterium]